jgi:nickel/cobalt transporter (NicO) family protein
MKLRKYRVLILSFLSFFIALIISIGVSTPSFAHWADLAVAEVNVGDTQTEINLTFPTGLVSFADENKDGTLEENEIRQYQGELEKFLSDKVRLTTVKGEEGKLIISLTPIVKTNISFTTHTTLQLNYTWKKKVLGLRMSYNLFLTDSPAAHCLVNIFHKEEVRNVILNRNNNSVLLTDLTGFSGSIVFAMIGAFIWGAMHAMSPGHGKTIVGAYLVGVRATAKHALFLGMTTTLTHTLGVFALGLVSLYASKYVLPEQLLPYFNILSGLIVVTVGCHLLIRHWSNHHNSHHHSHHHSHDDGHHHHHSHDDGHHHHHHLPPDNSPITWRSLLILGISGGLVPCPSALVLLLSAIAIGQITFGLVLVLVFSLGLAFVLTTLGLLLVYAKQRFEHLPKSIQIPRFLPAVSALSICLLGIGITAKAFLQMG